jgi:hypothetical protein
MADLEKTEIHYAPVGHPGSSLCGVRAASFTSQRHLVTCEDCLRGAASPSPEASAPPAGPPAEPLALIVKGRVPDQVVAWACGRCGIVHQHEANARVCLSCSCGRCGKPREKDQHESICGECHAKMFAEADEREAAKERSRYEKAAKVAWSAYGGECFYSPEADGGGGGEGFFWDQGEFLDYFAEKGEEPPAYAWACNPTRLTLTAGDIIANALENGDFHEEAGEDIPRGAAEEMQAFLDEWTAEHSPVSYFPDYSRAIDMTEVLRAAAPSPSSVDSETT